jgi:hypothetical protein
MALTRIRAQQISNIDYKQAVRVVTISNINLTGGAPSSVDGVALSVNSRILVNGQSTQTQNGLYLVQTLGTGSNGTWVRTNDTNTTGEMEAGMVVTVTEGNTYRDTLWTLTTDDPVVIGSSNITFQQSTSFSFGNIAANGTAILANTVGDAISFVAGDNISITGNATAKTVTFGVTGIQSTSISNGTSNVSIDAANANITVGVNGTGNVAVFAASGVTVAGNILPSANVTYNLGSSERRWKDLWVANSTIYLGEAVLSANGNVLLVNQQAVITSAVANSLTLLGNISGGNLISAGVVSGTTGTFTNVGGNGSALTSLAGANVTGTVANATYATSAGSAASATSATTAGTVTTNAQPNITSVGTLTSLGVTGNITGGNLSGSLVTGTLTTGAQPNITSLGTLNGLTVTGISSFTGNLDITGNINATGNLNYENVSDLVVGDPLIYIGEDNTGNLFDLGIIVNWNDGVYQHGGWARDASDGTWKLFGNVIPEPTTTIDFTNAIYEPMLAGSVTTIGNISGNYILGNGSQLTGIVAGGGIEWTTQANTSPASPVAGDFWYDSYTDKKYQYTNDGVSNYWVDQSFPTSYSSLAVTGNIVAGNVLITGNIVGNIVAQTITANVVGSVTGNLTGNVFGNLIGNSYGNSTGTHFGNVTGNLTGSVLTAAQPAITGVGTLSSLSVTGNITTSAYFFGDGSQLTGISSTGSFIANGTSNVSIATTNGNITATVSGTEILKITSAGIENSRANGVGNIGNSTTYFNTVFAKATSAQYADLAEMYIADAVYPPGTVLIFGGTHEVTASSISHDPRTAGVVSTNPSYLMNSGLAGPNTAAVALTGRVPCWVQGPVAKGDRLVNIDTGVAGRLDMDKYEVGCVIGKSLEAIKDSSLHLIEIAIGRY